jgi:prepilin-type N-terminal cleavage/methylation domain-containing protein
MEQEFKKKKSILRKSTPRFLSRFLRTWESCYNLSSNGYSVIEVLVVIALIGIICTIAAPNVSTMMKSYRLKSAANELASTLQLAKITAISQNANSVLTFNSASQTYSAFSDNGDGGGTVNDGTQSGSEPTIATVNLENSYYGEAVLNTPSFGNTIVFTSQGACNQSGTISLHNSDSETFQIIISPAGSIKLIKP